MRTIEYHITPQQEGMSVERYLKGVHGYSSRTIVKLKHYEQGMRLNGEHTRTIDLLRAGDCLQITFLDSSEHGWSTLSAPIAGSRWCMRMRTCWFSTSLRICPATNPVDTQRIHWQTSLLPTATGWVWT